MFLRVTPITPNLDEAGLMVGRTLSSPQDILQAVQEWMAPGVDALSMFPLYLQSTSEQMHGGRTRHRAVGTILLRQQQGIGRGVATRKGMGLGPIALLQALAVHNKCQQSCEWARP
jgi:hypothetical protein